MIVVYTLDEERVEFPGANRWKTDEHNNLDIMAGSQNNPDALGCFNRDNWIRVLVEGEDGE